MAENKTVVALDVGEKRIGVAVGDTKLGIAVPFLTLDVDGSELERVTEIAVGQNASLVVVGYPRNQAGEATAQTVVSERFAERLAGIVPEVVFQDESLTSVLAEERLKAAGRPYQRSDIDAEAARIILQDYLDGAHRAA